MRTDPMTTATLSDQGSGTTAAPASHPSRRSPRCRPPPSSGGSGPSWPSPPWDSPGASAVRCRVTRFGTGCPMCWANRPSRSPGSGNATAQRTSSPLAKLLIYASFSAFGLDERPVVLLNVGLFALLAAAMIWAVGKVRGGPATPTPSSHSPCSTRARRDLLLGGDDRLRPDVLPGRDDPGHPLRHGFPLHGPLGGPGRHCLVLLPLTFGGGLVFAACLSCGLGCLGLV